MTDYSVRHRTTYRYMQDVSYSRHLLHLAPRETKTQRLAEYRLSVAPTPDQHISRRDFFGNPVDWLALDEPHAEVEVIAESRVAALAPRARDPAASQPWEAARTQLEAAAPAAGDVVQYSFDSPLTAFSVDLAGYARRSFTPGRPMLAAALELMTRIHDDFRYDTTVTDAATPVDRVFEIRAGVCQDLAHVGIAALRALGLPARYVSGYLLTKPPPGRERLLGADASHAWFAVWAPPFGWVDLDPTNDMIPGDGHITVAWGRDYGDVAPINGIVTGGGEHAIEVGVDVLPIG
jgi:transglutaminase-like putative cysteine protease